MSLSPTFHFMCVNHDVMPTSVGKRTIHWALGHRQQLSQFGGSMSEPHTSELNREISVIGTNTASPTDNCIVCLYVWYMDILYAFSVLFVCDKYFHVYCYGLIHDSTGLS